MRGIRHCIQFAAVAVVILAALGASVQAGVADEEGDWAFACSPDEIERYTSYRIDEAISVDGHLDEPVWKTVPRSPRFEDLISGSVPLYDTRAAVLWDEKRLYIGFWVEEPFVEGDLTERDSPIYQNNDVEVFIAGKDSYYEFEINSLATIYEVFFRMG